MRCGAAALALLLEGPACGHALACLVEHPLSPTGDKAGEADLLALRSLLPLLGDGHCLLFQAGDYFFDSNRWIATGEEPPSCGGNRKCKDAIAHLQGLRDVVISGPEKHEGIARLLLNNHHKDRGDQVFTAMWNLAQCTNVTIQRLTIEHTRESLSHLVAEVVSVGAFNRLFVKVPADYLPLQAAAYTDIDGLPIHNPRTCDILEATLGWCGIWCGVFWGAVACTMGAVSGFLGCGRCCCKSCYTSKQQRRVSRRRWAVGNGAACGVLFASATTALSFWELGGPMQADSFFATHMMRLDSDFKVTGWESFPQKLSYGRAYDAKVASDQADCESEDCVLLQVSFFHESDLFCRTPRDVSRVFAEGDHLLALHQKRAVAGVWFDDIEGLTLRDLTFGNLAGPSIAGHRVRDIHVSRQVARRPEVGWRTINDALWVRGYAGSNNLVEDMDLEHLTDDFFNFHTSQTRIAGGSAFAKGHELCMEVETAWWWDTPANKSAGAWAKVGDVVNLLSNDSVTLSRAEFRGRRSTGSGIWSACFREVAGFPLHAVVPDVAFATTPRWMPDDVPEALVIRNVRVRNSRSRGMIKGSNTLVDGIEVVDNTMTGLAVVSEPCDWGEGTSASNVTIRNALFENTALDTKKHIAAISVFTHVCTGRGGLQSLAQRKAHNNISIENAMIRNQPQAAIFAAGVDGLHFRNVTVEGIRAKSDLRNPLNGESSAAGELPDFQRRPDTPGSQPVAFVAVTGFQVDGGDLKPNAQVSGAASWLLISSPALLLVAFSAWFWRSLV